MAKIRVLVVDDSAVVRQVLTEVLNASHDIEVTATAADPIIARSRMEKEWPDVIITDIEMPRMDGISFIEQVMKERPTPMVVCSSLAGESATLSMKALAAGAVDVIAKPKIGVKDFLNESETILIDAVRAACQIDLKHFTQVSHHLTVEPKLSPDAMLPPSNAKASHTEGKSRVVILGASAGGTQAIERVLRALPADCPPIAIVQHMPEVFTKAFADRLNTVCAPSISEAVNGDHLEDGRIFIAPGGRHMMIEPSGGGYCVVVKDGPLVSRHRPSVDVLFRSAAKYAGRNALGIILTGMGDDGALGMSEMHASGVTTIAQSEETCAVFGMPKEAIRRGGVDRILNLDEIAPVIMAFHPAGKKS
jgi:two-component system chemotaxis response regulator CheB